MSLTDLVLELQAVDTAADQLRHRRDHLAELESARHARAALLDWERSRTRLRGRLDELERTIEESESSAAEIDRARQRLEAQLRTVIAPREAEALNREIDTLTGRRDELDERELAALEEQSAVDDTLVQEAALESSLRGALAHADAGLEAVQADLDAELTRLDARRAEVRAELDAGLLARYDRLRAHLGIAVARLAGRRCEGCHLDLSPAEVDIVKDVPPGEFAECPQCSRLLVR